MHRSCHCISILSCFHHFHLRLMSDFCKSSLFHLATAQGTGVSLPQLGAIASDRFNFSAGPSMCRARWNVPGQTGPGEPLGSVASAASEDFSYKATKLESFQPIDWPKHQHLQLICWFSLRLLTLLSLEKQGCRNRHMHAPGKASKRAMIGVNPEHKSYFFRKPLGFSRGQRRAKETRTTPSRKLFQSAAMLCLNESFKAEWSINCQSVSWNNRRLLWRRLVDSQSWMHP